MKVLIINDTAKNMQTRGTPYKAGFNGVLVNLTAGSLTIQGSEDGVTYSTLATLGASTSITAMAEVTIPNYIKVSTAASVWLLADN